MKPVLEKEISEEPSHLSKVERRIETGPLPILDLDRPDSTSTFKLTLEQRRVAFDRLVSENLRPAAIGLGSLYIFFAILHLLLQREPVRSVMTVIALLSAGGLFAFWFVLRKKSFPLAWTHPITGAMAGIVLFNSLVHLYIARTPRDTTNLSLLVIGAGCVFLSVKWYSIIVGATFAGWILATSIFTGSVLSADYDFGLFSATALATIIHAARVRIYTRLEELRQRDERRKTELEAALRSAEREIIERKKVESALEKARAELEMRVLERTNELAKANQALRSEIEEKLRAENALRTSETRLVLAQKIGHVGSWDFDLSDRSMNWSAETFRILGWDQGPLTPTQKDFIRAIHPEDRVAVESAFEAALGKSTPFTLEHRIVRPGGVERLVCERAELIFDASGRPIHLAGTIQDITDQRHLEMQLRHSQKMDAIGQLAAGVAHDFNNILTIIQGHTALLYDVCRANPEATEMLHEITQAGERAALLTTQLLLFSRKRVMQPCRLDLSDIISNWENVLGRLLGEQITLCFTLASNLPMVNADPAMIEQILMNLAVNARDAMPRGGTVTIGTSAEVINEVMSRSSPEARSGQFVRLSVSDTGSGIDPKVLPRIFEPFFTTKPLGKGTGLGLSTAYGIVRQHGGWIDVVSEPNRGTSFHIFLPVSVKEGVPVSQDKIAAPVIQGGTEQIMVVEDESAVRMLICRLLRRHGYHILEAASGVDALILWNKHREEIDLLLTDLVMPGGLSGRELAQKCVAQRPDLRVIYTSGYSTDFADLETSLGPRIHFLAKPYQFPALAKLIRDCLDAKS